MNEPMERSWVTPLNEEDREYFPISAQFVRGTISIHPELPVWNTTL